MPDETMRALLDRLIAATHARDLFFDADAERPQPGPPASPARLAALEQRWGGRLSPAHRRLLAVADGLSDLGCGLALLSTAELLDDAHAHQPLEEATPEHWRTVFALDPDGYDALAFDRSRIAADGEAAVVHVHAGVEDERWPSLTAFLRATLQRVEAELALERADRENLGE